MKQRFKIVLSLLLAILFGAPVFAQNEALAGFEVRTADKQVVIDWTIRGGNSCSDVTVEHSADGVEFSEIHLYPGLCGGTPLNQTYSFLHKEPVNGALNYYRVNLGRDGVSDIKSVWVFDLSATGYSVFPMPATDATVIHFFNSSPLPFTIRIIDLAGRTIYKKENITESQISLKEARLTRGTNLFELTNGSQRHTGKIISQ